MWDVGGSKGSNWRKRRGPRTLSAKETDKAQEEKKRKIKFIIGLFARADVKAHTYPSILFRVCWDAIHGNHNQNPRLELMRVKNQMRILGRMNASTINNHDLARYEVRSSTSLPNPIQQGEMQHLYFHSFPNRFDEPQSGKTIAQVPATSTVSAEEKTCFPVTKP